MKTITLLTLRLLLLLLIVVPAVWAGPAIPTPTEVTQPDGSRITVRIRGDEHQNWMEVNPTGHTIVKNKKTQYWEYAERLPDGSLTPSGVKVEPGGRNAPAFIPKGLKPERNKELDAPRALMTDGISRQAAVPASPPVGYDVAAAPGPPGGGIRNVLIVLVNFSDRTLVTTPAGWYGKIFDTTPGGKTVANFYHDNSLGAATILPALHTQPGNPAGIVTASLSVPHPYYTGGTTYDSDVAIANDALARAAAYINFSSYDGNGDGVLQPSELAIYFIYAGYEASGTSKAPNVWGHAWSGGTIAAGSLQAHYWAVNGELNDAQVQHPIGVIVHELGHSLFELPDLYDTTYTNTAMGLFSTMAFGSWGYDVSEYPGTTPTTLDAFSRELLGWSVPVEPPGGSMTVAPSLSSLAAAYRFIHAEVNSREYFLLENRQPAGWDTGLRGMLGANWLGGLLLLHVDNTSSSNSYIAGSHQRVVPVQARADCDMQAYSYCYGSASTLFYEGNNSAWTPTSAPNSNYYSGLPTGFSLTGISVPSAEMSAQYHPDVVAPVVTAFSVPVTSGSLTVPITSLAATDNVAVTGYLVTESAATPAATHPAWSAGPPASYAFATEGAKTLYTWAKDAAGNVSASRFAAVTISSDAAAPIVTAFSVPATYTSRTVPITAFTATDNVGVTGYLVNENPAKPLPNDPGWSAGKPASYTVASLGNRTLYAWARDAAGNVSDSRFATVQVIGLPGGWETTDIGSVGVAGSAFYASGSFTVKGSGADIWGTSDAFRFLYMAMTGDCVMIARVNSLQNTNGHAKGGVMIREALTADSKHAMVALTPQYGAEFSRRSVTGGSTQVTGRGGVAAPYWVRVERIGNTFTGYVSAEGGRWSKVGSSTIAMGSTVYVGLVASSHDNSSLCSATMEWVLPTRPDTTAPTVNDFSVPATSSSLTLPVTTLAATDDQYVFGYLLTESAAKPALSNPAWSIGYSSRPHSYTFATPGVKTLYAWAMDLTGNISLSRSAAVDVALPLPTPWLTADIGSIGVTGSAGYENGTFILQGSGADVWGSADAFRFAYVTLTGDGSITARVSSLQNTHGYAKGGVMMRESLAAGSRHVLVDLTPQNGAEFLRRTVTGAAVVASGQGGVAAPYWVRLIRSGNRFTGYVSADGAKWVRLGSSTVAMASTVYVGLVASSHDNSTLCVADFDRVSLALDRAAPTVTEFGMPPTSWSFTVPIWSLTATDDICVAGYLVKEDPSKPAATDPAWSPTRPARYIFATAGVKTLYAWAKDQQGNVSDSRSATVAITPVLPPYWHTADIGSVGVTGNASCDFGIFTLLGSGADIYGGSDAFRFVYKQMTGDGYIVARVTSLQNTHPFAKGGVMMRESLDANARHAMMVVTPGYGAEYSRRSVTGGATEVNGRDGVAAPYWVRLVRNGDTFTGYVSEDMSNWIPVGGSTMSMGSTIYIGLVVTSHDNDVISATTMEDVIAP